MEISTTSNERGFTLVELLVVVAIIGLLASVTLANLTTAKAKARDAKRISDLRELEKAVEAYANTTGSYPSTSGNWWGNCATYGGHATSGSNGWIPNIAPTYIPILPLDPNPIGTDKCYLYKSDGLDYMILVHQTIESFDPWHYPTPSSGPHPLYRPAFNQQSIALYTTGARLW